jgi:hypothetical protein
MHRDGKRSVSRNSALHAFISSAAETDSCMRKVARDTMKVFDWSNFNLEDPRAYADL